MIIFEEGTHVRKKNSLIEHWASKESKRLRRIFTVDYGVYCYDYEQGQETYQDYLLHIIFIESLCVVRLSEPKQTTVP